MELTMIISGVMACIFSLIAYKLKPLEDIEAKDNREKVLFILSMISLLVFLVSTFIYVNDFMYNEYN